MFNKVPVVSRPAITAYTSESPLWLLCHEAVLKACIHNHRSESIGQSTHAGGHQRHIPLSGPQAGAALATVVGALVEVPVMQSLVALAFHKKEGKPALDASGKRVT